MRQLQRRRDRDLRWGDAYRNAALWDAFFPYDVVPCRIVWLVIGLKRQDICRHVAGHRLPQPIIVIVFRPCPQSV